MGVKYLKAKIIKILASRITLVASGIIACASLSNNGFEKEVTTELTTADIITISIWSFVMVCFWLSMIRSFWLSWENARQNNA